MADYGSAISLSQGRELSHTSEDDDSEHSARSVPNLSAAPPGPAGSSPPSKHKKTTAIIEFGSTPEVSKKPRGRPPGSKNKPKPPIIITKDRDSAMKPVVLEISAGSDVVETVMQFARRRHVGIIVLSGSGSVSNVTLRHPVSHAPSLALHGPFSLLSLSGSSPPPPPPAAVSFASSSSSFGICLAGAQGQVFGGIVGGKVVAASLVVVVAATYTSPAFHRLPSEADEAVEEAKPNIGGNASESNCSTSSNAMCMPVYSVASPTPLNCQISPDVMPWGPTSRSPY
jgi:predicted DNA-binding protein with PD1-like motif